MSFNTKVIIGVIVLAVVAIMGVGFFAPPQEPVAAPVATTTPEAVVPSTAYPWIEVVKGKAYRVAEGEATSTELISGDELNPPVTVETRANSRAVIHFPDGSVARLDANTKLILEQGDFDPATAGLSVKMSLLVGKVWSKIIELATPESFWKVETSNAVATVRGTAFGVSSDGKKSRIIGSQHKIGVALLDPRTKEIVKEDAGEVEEGKVLDIADSDVPALADGTKKLAVVSLSARVLAADVWATENKTEDQKVEEDITELKEQGLEGDDLREELERRTEDRKEDIINLRESEESNADIKPITDEALPKVIEAIKTGVEPLPVKREADITTTVFRAPRPIRLELSSDARTKEFPEGTQVHIIAKVVFEDGTTRIVTDKSRFQVLGGVGVIEKPGLFLAKLDPSVAEFGRVSGAITAVWTDPVSGKELFAKSPIFEVVAVVESDSATSI